MGKRKKSSRGPTGPKKREPLATTFQCLFCNHEKSVTVKLYKKEGIGQLDCRICGQSYQSGINYLSAAVDVYTDWIDACEAVADKEDTNPARGARENTRRIDSNAPRGEPLRHAALEEEDDMDGFIENDEPDDEAAYTGTGA